MSGVQTENGYTRIANELLEQISKFKFNGTEFRIIMVVWRYTYGFNRKSHPLSTSFISEAVGIENSRVRKVLKKLIDTDVIQVLEEATFNESRVLTFNKNYKKWGVEKDQRGKEKPLPPKRTQPEGSNKTQPQGAKRTQPQGSKTTPKKDIFKDSIKESIKDNNKGLPMVDEYFGEVIKFYEQNIGLISPYVSQQIGYLVDESNSELVLLALKKSVEANANNKFKYARAIVDSWKSQNFKTIKDVENDEKRKANSNPSRGNVHSLFEASPETLERQRRMVEEHQKNKKEIDYTDLPY